MSNPRVYATLSRWNCVYDFSFILEAWIEIYPPYRVAIKDNTYAIAPNLYHNANNLPLWTWWQSKIFKVILPLCHQEQRVVLPMRACWNICPAELTMLPLIVGKICKKMCFKKNQDLYIIEDLPITKRLNTYIQHPTKWGSSTQPSGDTSKVYIWQPITLHFYPRHSGETRIGHYMTLTP